MKLSKYEGRYFELCHGLTTEGTYSRSDYKSSNQAKAVGYLIKELKVENGFPVKEDGEFVEIDRLYLTSMQIRQVLTEGNCVNGYLQKQIRNGKEVSRIMPKGSKKGLSKDTNVRYAFKTDEDGDIIKPFELDIQEEECSSKLWDILLERQQKQFRQRSSRKFITRNETEQDMQKRVELEEYVKTVMGNVGADDAVAISNPIFK